ncbi:MAG: MBL fold metallo-hydrolase [Pseudomonadota bacterium]
MIFRVFFGVLAALVLFIAVASVYLLQFGPTLDESALPPFSAHSASPDGNVEFQFLGNANILLRDNETAVLIDGFFTRPSSLNIAFGKIEPDLDAISAAMARASIDTLDVVIPVHSHYDHAMDSPEVARRTGALLLGSNSSANIGRGWGLPESQIRVADPGVSYDVGRFRVTLLESRHFVFPDLSLPEDPEIHAPLVPPVKAMDYREGGAYSVLIEHPESGRWLVQGSAGFLPGALSGLKADIVFLGIGGLAGQTAEYQRNYWHEVVMATNPDVVVPIHFDAIADSDLGDSLVLGNNLWSKVLAFKPLESIAAVNELAAETGVSIAYPKLWERVYLGI